MYYITWTMQVYFDFLIWIVQIYLAQFWKKIWYFAALFKDLLYALSLYLHLSNSIQM